MAKRGKKVDATEEGIVSYKGFDSEFKCRGHQFEIGKTYPVATGYRSAATNTGKYGAAFATGIEGRVSGGIGCSLHLDERRKNYGADNHGEILHVWAGIVGKDGIKPDTFYTLKDGKPVEAA